MTEGFLSKLPKLPLLVSMGPEDSSFKFNHPLNNITHTMSIPEVPTGSEIRSSKFGWLLMSKGKFTMFFFNPFTKEKIDLPDLPWDYNFNCIGFSSPPTSSECIIFTMREKNRKDTEFAFLRHGQNTWNQYKDYNEYDFIPSFNGPIFHEGVFYLLGQKGNLGIYNPDGFDSGNWTVITSPNIEPCSSIRIGYLAKSNKDIVAVFEGNVGKFVKIFKFDPLKKVWRKQFSLGDQMLFLSMTASFSTTNETARALGLENKIYTPRFHNNNGVFYSPVTSMFHTFWDDFASEDGYNTTEKLHCTWIEPNFEVHSNEELKWYQPPLED